MKIGEVIESSTSLFTAQVPKEVEAPPTLGSWVRVESDDGVELIGVVCHVERGSLMHRRRATALGKTTEELQREMPHILAMLQTTFQVMLVAYRSGGRIRQTLPPLPANFHESVYACTDKDLQQIDPPYDFLRILLSVSEPSVSVDDLMVAVLQHMHRAGGPVEGRQALLEAGKTLSRLLRDDHERMQAILRRV